MAYRVSPRSLPYPSSQLHYTSCFYTGTQTSYKASNLTCYNKKPIYLCPGIFLPWHLHLCLCSAFRSQCQEPFSGKFRDLLTRLNHPSLKDGQSPPAFPSSLMTSPAQGRSFLLWCSWSRLLQSQEPSPPTQQSASTGISDTFSFRPFIYAASSAWDCFPLKS